MEGGKEKREPPGPPPMTAMSNWASAKKNLLWKASGLETSLLKTVCMGERLDSEFF